MLLSSSSLGKGHRAGEEALMGWQDRGLGSGIASSDLINCLGVCTPRWSELKSEWGRAVCEGVCV